MRPRNVASQSSFVCSAVVMTGLGPTGVETLTDEPPRLAAEMSASTPNTKLPDWRLYPACTPPIAECEVKLVARGISPVASVPLKNADIAARSIELLSHA